MLSRSKFASRWAQAERTPLGLLDELRGVAFVTSSAQVPRVVPNDADDDHVIAAAVAGGAELIVSGDSDLITMGSHQGIGIVSAAMAVQTIGVTGKV